MKRTIKKSFIILLIVMMKNGNMYAQFDSLRITLTDMQCQLSDMIVQGKEVRKTAVKFDCPERAESGTLNLYLLKKDTLKITVSSAQGSHSGQESEYYIAEGNLIFYRTNFSVWTFDPEYSNDTVPQTIDYFSIREMYFHNDTAVFCREKNYLIKSSLKVNLTEADVDFKEIGCEEDSQVLTEFRTLMRFFISKPGSGTCPFK